MHAEIEQRLETSKDRLAPLGEGKDSTAAMRAELVKLCERSVRLTHAAVEGHGINPSGEDFFPSHDDGKTYDRNLRSRVVKQNRLFAEQMENWGSSCLIVNDEESQSQNRKPTIRRG